MTHTFALQSDEALNARLTALLEILQDAGEFHETHLAVVVTQSPRQSGQSFGAGFARVSLADRDLVNSFAHAINQGVAADRQRADEACELSQDADALRSMGFDGCDED